MTQTNKSTPQCCGQTLKADKNSDGIFFYKCQKCGKTSTGKTPAEAAEKWDQGAGANTAISAIPATIFELRKWANGNINTLIQSSAAWLDADKNKPATRRMIRQNIEYIIDNTNLNDAWGTPEGRKSIIAALKESFYYGASMPDMGCVVPFGKKVEFIPDVETFKFALTTGDNAPFESLTIELVYDNDKVKCSRINGNFQVEFENIPPKRGNVRGVVVYGLNKVTGKIDGEMFDKDRLIEKAETHSAAYKSYLEEKNYAAHLQAEGKTKIKNGREYYIKTLNKKDGGTWDKEIYLDSITSPYVGSDQPEMLRKLAGKTFCRPFMKVRNAMELAKEWSDEEYTVDSILDKAKEQVDVEETTETEIKDAEFEAIKNEEEKV